MESSEEIAVCEFCAKKGPRESFYSNSKRFCSATCSHSFSAQHRFGKNVTNSSLNSAAAKLKQSKSQNLLLPSESERQQCISMGFNWGTYLVSKRSNAASVELFQHAPMAAHWGEIGNGMKLEVLNLDCNLNTKVFWITSVVQVAGYKAKLRYEGFGDDSSCDFWCNLCTLDVHAVGWCATIGKPLVPPQTIQHKYSNWKSFLVKRLTGAKTLPNDFQKRVVDSVKSPLLCNMRLEVVDKTRISRMRVGIIEEIIGGRLRLRYEDSEYENDDFWCHSQSALLHPIGWCERVGHKILVASKDYKTKKGFKNARPELFLPVKQVKSCGFKVGMKLEAIDPLNLSAICVATVKKVLKNGYVMIGIDGSEAADGSDWFCYHCTAPSIFPVGFCMENGISLSVPKSYKDNFSWEDYLNETNSVAAPVDHFENELPDHRFKPGMKLEAVDLMEPRLICVATVTKVIGRLLHVHFDGWENQYDQWVDCRSPDLYPIGWCELVGYELQPPPNMLTPADAGSTKKKKLKGLPFTTKKKRKRPSVGQKKPGVPERDDQQKLPTPPPADGAAEKMETEPSPVPQNEEQTAKASVEIKEEPQKKSESEAPEPIEDKTTETTSDNQNENDKTTAEIQDNSNTSLETDQASIAKSQKNVEEADGNEIGNVEVPETQEPLKEETSVDQNPAENVTNRNQEENETVDQTQSLEPAKTGDEQTTLKETSTAESTMDQDFEKPVPMQENTPAEEKMDISVPEQKDVIEETTTKTECADSTDNKEQVLPEDNAEKKAPMEVDESAAKSLDS